MTILTISFLLLKKCYWIQYSYWSELIWIGFLKQLRRFGFSTRSLGHMMFRISRQGKHHVTKTSSWEAEKSWQFQKHDPKWVKSSFIFTVLYQWLWYQFHLHSFRSVALLKVSFLLFWISGYDKFHFRYSVSVTVLTVSLFYSGSLTMSSMSSKLPMVSVQCCSNKI